MSQTAGTATSRTPLKRGGSRTVTAAQRNFYRGA